MLWRKIIGFWKSIAVAGVIAYGCLLRKPLYTLPPIEGGDKWVHWLAFLILTLVLLWDSRAAGLKSWKMWLVAVAIPVVYGGVIELLQEQFFYPRTGEWMDWLADGVGVCMGVICWRIGMWWHERRVGK